MNNTLLYKGNRNCPVCCCNIKRKLFPVKMAMPSNIGLPDEYNVAECDYCGCCYADTSATAEDYDNYYRENNFYGEIDIKISTYKRLYELTIDELKRLHITTEKMVDIGFGSGELCVMLRDNGFKNIRGVDPSLTSVEHLKKQGIECRQGSIYDYVPESEQKQYKVVFMYGMIEHLYNPVNAIERAKAYLSDDGYMFWLVPLFDNMKDDLTPVVNNFNVEHINYFSEISLDNVAKICGLKKVTSYSEVLAEVNNSRAYGTLAVYQMKNDVKIGGGVKKDCVTAKSILEYYSRIIDNDNALQTFINELRDSGEEIVVWGTGAYMKNLWATTSLKECNVSVFIDNNEAKVGTNMFDKEIAAPTYLLQNYSGKIVICCMMYSEEIVKQIQSMNPELADRIIVL